MASDVGSQLVTLKWFDEAASRHVNKYFQDTIPVGIYKGGYLEKVDNTHVNISPLICMISDGDYQVRVETTVEISSLEVTNAAPYIILRWKYTGSETADYMEVLAENYEDIDLETDLIVGKCSYSEATLSGFNYGALEGTKRYFRSTPNVQDLFLKVEAPNLNDPDITGYPMRVRVRAGRVQIGTLDKEISDQITPSSFTSTVTNIGLVYVDYTGTVQITAGTADSIPAYPENSVVLAEVRIPIGTTQITQEMIHDCRDFLKKEENQLIKVDQVVWSGVTAGLSGAEVNTNLSSYILGANKHVFVLLEMYCGSSEADVFLVKPKGGSYYSGVYIVNLMAGQVWVETDANGIVSWKTYESITATLRFVRYAPLNN